MNVTTSEYIGEDLLRVEGEGAMEIAPIQEDFEERVQEAQEQLLKLRHQQDLLEKQKSELELLSQQQEQFMDGRSLLSEKLQRGISTMEREAFEAEKRVEQYLHIKDTFGQHVEILEALTPESWSRSELRGELGRALTAIEEAESDYENCMSRAAGLLDRNPEIASGSPLPVSYVSADGKNNFTSWFVKGLAFTLPLVIFGFLGLVVYLFFAA